MAANPPVVRLRGVTKRFRDFWLRPRITALEGLDLEVARGEILGLLGPNGSGKSTTIKIVLGLLFPSSGQVDVLGRPPGDVRTKSRIGYLAEETSLYPFLNARETLDFFGRLFGLSAHERRRRIDELIAMVGLTGAQFRPVGEYSKGMQRRIGLAQALINDPDLLVLDEPTSGLDPIGTSQVKDLIVELGKRGKTIIVCSHLLADIEAVCTRLVILYGGRLLREGTVAELLTIQDQMLLRVPRLAPATLARMREVCAADGQPFLDVSAPHKPLEALFLELVEEAQRRGFETSGAGRGGALASFLSAPTTQPSGANAP
ncbi:MAG: ABC transporter ATP-binding protein [Planctomycetota bacterium]